MPDTEEDDFGKAMEAAFADDGGDVETPVTPPVDPATPPAPANVEEPKKDDSVIPANPDKKEEEPVTPAADPAKPADAVPATPQTPETPSTPEEPKPLTEDSIRQILSDVRTEERTSGQALKEKTNDVLEAYYPGGLSNVLVDENTNKELRTPQDVVDASGGKMDMEEATKWLLNEQYKLDQSISKIRSDAERVAETTMNFKRDSMDALKKYGLLFKQYPQLQPKVYNLLMRQTKLDEAKGVVLQAPDVMELYDDYLEPYKLAYEFATKQPATSPVTPPAAATPLTPATPGASDRMDESGDGGIVEEVDDPNDFAQQVTKALNNPA